MQQQNRRPMTFKVSCFNRPAFQDTVLIKDRMVQIGETKEGAIIMGQQMQTIPDPMTKSCRVDFRFANPDCSGCKWQNGIDRRDPEPTRKKISEEILLNGLTPVDI